MDRQIGSQNLSWKWALVSTLLYQLLLASVCQSAWSAEAKSTATASVLPTEPFSDGLLLQQSQNPVQITDRLSSAELSVTISQSSPIEISGVQVTPTATGLAILLQTEQEELSVLTPTTVGNALIADIPNAVIADEFSQANPSDGIALVSVTSLPDNRVRIAITGTDAPPTAAISAAPTGLALAVTPGTAMATDEDEAIQVVVTGEQDEGYNPSEATTATRTDTPLRDIPQSIQVVPGQVIEDQAITRTSDALRNVSGVSVQREFGDSIDIFTIRGFSSFQNLRNGASLESPYLSPDNIERIEVLKGPASVLYGQIEPGGIVNYVTEQPLSDPYYSFEFTGGSYSLYRPAIDISGPLTADERLLYRLNVSYENADSYIDFVDGRSLLIAPTLSYRISDDTNITLEYEYIECEQTFFNGLLPIPETFDLPTDRNLGEPADRYRRDINNFSLTLDHRFNENLRLRNTFNAFFSLEDLEAVRADTPLDPVTSTVPRIFQDNPSLYQQTYSTQTDLIANFDTGPIAHQLLFGVNFQWDFRSDEQIYFNAAPLNIFDPVYGQPLGEFDSDPLNTFVTNTAGIYLQDQITLLPNLRLLIGRRYDFVSADFEYIDSVRNGAPIVEEEFYDEAFSPRIGIVYQPLEPISLYASYSRSFVPNQVTDANGAFIEPTRGTQYEVGIRAELNDRLTANLAAYDITKTNILTTDPNDNRFSIGVGEVRSRGVEFDVLGEILPGWNVIASYYINDAFVSEDNTLPEGDTLVNAPRQGGSLWTTYEIQDGDLAGLGFGLGLFYVGDRETVIPNDFVIPSYVRADASLFYRRDNWRVGLNFRNLFDTEYFDSFQGRNLRRGEPFTVLGTVAIEF
jgi:iron complex outermembrane receptor protein